MQPCGRPLYSPTFVTPAHPRRLETRAQEVAMDDPAAFIGRSAAIARVLERIERAAQVDVPVLITGETGTGKSHLAKLLHARSRRATRAFVAANCAAIPEALFESEMFGHARGAFTGAVESRIGLFEEAHSGTLFLDELGELPLVQQAKLLTVIEEREVRPVGATRAKKVDVRIVSATSCDLGVAVRTGDFRADLYHRVALICCEIPPLRERPEDLREMVGYLLRSISRKYKRPALELSTEAWEMVMGHSWPGNVRELAHVLEAAVVLATGRVLSLADVRGAKESGMPTCPTL
jgi:transcriptional regulator with PAS, ATPase and Fis domain